MNIRPDLKIFMDEFSERFKKNFNGMLVNHFIDSLLYSIGIVSFDVVGFDNYLHTKYSDYKKNESQKHFIEKEFGKDAANLIQEILNYDLISTKQENKK